MVIARSIWQPWLYFRKLVGLQVVFFEQVVEVSPVLTGELRRLTHVALGHRQNLNEIISFKGIARIFERPQPATRLFHSFLNEILRPDRKSTRLNSSH